MSQVCISDALKATQVQMFYYCWNHCSVCSISMLEYEGKTNETYCLSHVHYKSIYSGSNSF